MKPCLWESSALKTITAELPPDGKVAATACAKLTPKLLAQIQNVRSTLLHIHKNRVFEWSLGYIRPEAFPCC